MLAPDCVCLRNEREREMGKKKGVEKRERQEVQGKWLRKRESIFIDGKKKSN